MFILNANQMTNEVTGIVNDCSMILFECDIDNLITRYESEKLLMESEELTHFDNLVGVINLKALPQSAYRYEQIYRPVYSQTNANSALVDTLCSVLNEKAYGNNGYVSARNAWFELFHCNCAVTINLAQCETESMFRNICKDFGEYLAIALIKYLIYVYPKGAHIISAHASKYFGKRSDYLNNKYPFE